MRRPPGCSGWLGKEDAIQMAVPLRRTTFSTKHVMEFFREKELDMQLGYSRLTTRTQCCRED